MNAIFNGRVSYLALKNLKEIDEPKLELLKLPDRPKLTTRWLAFLGWTPAQKDCSSYKAAVANRREMLAEVRRVLRTEMSDEVAIDCADDPALKPILRARSAEDMTERHLAEGLLQVGVALRVHATDTQRAFQELHPTNKLRDREMRLAAYHVITDLMKSDFEPSVRHEFIGDFSALCAGASERTKGLTISDIKVLATAFLTERDIRVE